MYDVKRITAAIARQVGFERSYALELAPSLLVSETGLTYNQGHPLLGYKNIADTIDAVPVSAYPIHSEIAAYKAGEVVQKDGMLYQALEDVAAGVLDTAKWEKTNAVSLALKTIREQAASEVVAALLAQKQSVGKGKAIWENLTLYEGAGSLARTVTKSNRFVGFEISLKNLRDMAVRLHAIGLQVTSPQPSLPIYIYHTASDQPVKVLSLAQVRSGRFSWHELAEELVLRQSGQLHPDASYLVGYRESELTGFAVDKSDYEFGRVPCATCSSYNTTAYRQWSAALDIHPFSVPEAAIGEGDALWDLSAMSYNYKTNYGLNLSLTLECDVTDTLVKNAHHLAEAQKLAVVEKILRLFVSSTRNNADAQLMRQMADYELNNRENHTDGLTKKKEKVMAALDVNFSDLSPLCLPGRDTRISKGAM